MPTAKACRHAAAYDTELEYELWMAGVITTPQWVSTLARKLPSAVLFPRSVGEARSAVTDVVRRQANLNFSSQAKHSSGNAVTISEECDRPKDGSASLSLPCVRSDIASMARGTQAGEDDIEVRGERSYGGPLTGQSSGPPSTRGLGRREVPSRREEATAGALLGPAPAPGPQKVRR